MKDILKEYPLKEFKLERVIKEGWIASTFTKETQPTNRFILVNPKGDYWNIDAPKGDGYPPEKWWKFENWKEGLKPKGLCKGSPGYSTPFDEEFEQQQEIYNLLFIEGIEVDQEIKDLLPGFDRSNEVTTQELSITEIEPYKFVI